MHLITKRRSRRSVLLLWKELMFTSTLFVTLHVFSEKCSKFYTILARPSHSSISPSSRPNMGLNLQPRQRQRAGGVQTSPTQKTPDK